MQYKINPIYIVHKSFIYDWVHEISMKWDNLVVERTEIKIKLISHCHGEFSSFFSSVMILNKSN